MASYNKNVFIMLAALFCRLRSLEIWETRALYMIIKEFKVSRGTKALVRFRIARPADTFLTM